MIFVALWKRSNHESRSTLQPEACSTQEQMRQRHGTPEVFALACYKAVPRKPDAPANRVEGLVNQSACNNVGRMLACQWKAGLIFGHDETC